MTGFSDDDRTLPRVLQALIVEDSAPIAERLAEMVRVPGRVEVRANVTTERDALTACEANTFDLAVVDLQLAQGTGFGVIRRLRERAGPFTCVVVLTNHAVPALRTAAYQAGADHFLDKSKDFPSVSRLVADLLASRS
jgi:DNA-binding NarL/FixJ family response regulator